MELFSRKMKNSMCRGSGLLCLLKIELERPSMKDDNCVVVDDWADTIPPSLHLLLLKSSMANRLIQRERDDHCVKEA